MSPTPRPFHIVPCAEWGARPARRPVENAGHYREAIFHHTAGHAPELDLQALGAESFATSTARAIAVLEAAKVDLNKLHVSIDEAAEIVETVAAGPADESYEEARRYALVIQRLHMDVRGWNDSGHNFLTCRNGFIFEGRHRSLELLGSGQTPLSAHCVGHNDAPGVEIEHVNPESMTPIQWQATVWLFALICRRGGFGPAQIRGHRDYNATDCPGALYSSLSSFRLAVHNALAPAPAPWPAPPWFVDFAKWHLRGRDPETRPRHLPGEIPRRVFRELDELVRLAKEIDP